MPSLVGSEMCIRDRFFDSLQQSTAYRIAPQPCFEVYLNDGNHDGYWDIDMYVPVERVAS